MNSLYNVMLMREIVQDHFSKDCWPGKSPWDEYDEGIVSPQF